MDSGCFYIVPTIVHFGGQKSYRRKKRKRNGLATRVAKVVAGRNVSTG